MGCAVKEAGDSGEEKERKKRGIRKQPCGGRVAWQEAGRGGTRRVPLEGVVVAVQSALSMPAGTQEGGSLFQGFCWQDWCCSELQGHDKAFWLARCSENGVDSEHTNLSPFCPAL